MRGVYFTRVRPGTEVARIPGFSRDPDERSAPQKQSFGQLWYTPQRMNVL